MNTQTDSVSLTQNLTPEEISLTVSLTGEDIPSGWMETVAIVRAPSTQQEKAKKKGAARQKKLEDKRRNEGLKKEWVPTELLELVRLLGWAEVLRRIQHKRRPLWKFWRLAA